MEKKQKFYTYKGYHLVRKGNVIYYGNMSGDYVTKIDIQSTRKEKELEIANKLRIVLMPTDTEKPLDINKMKSAGKETLYEALQVAHTWLEKANG
ncbi:MAG: hypothetical protein FWH07_00900 [Oscillospiraceae bacterium]|nr:hypothetical protein [Oscillospiraceae bacterium]